MMEARSADSVSAPLPWQDRLWAHLDAQLAKDRLPHALLLTGMPGIGKGRLATALARRLLCEHPDAGLNCGKCKSCELSASGAHSDLRWLRPEGKSQLIKIDQVRAAVEFVGKTAALGQRKIVVVEPADRMNSNAANALLKALEEPAGNTCFLLVCTRLYGLPATVRSRCQLVQMKVPDAGRCSAWLQHITGDAQSSDRLLALANGRPLLAAQLFQAGDYEELGRRRETLRGLLLGRVSASVALSTTTDVSVDDLLEQLTVDLEKLIRALPDQHLRGVEGRAGFVVLDEIRHLQRASLSASNPNRQLLLEALFARIQRELGGFHLGDTMRGKQEAH